jgi:hypothetical protein
MKCQMLALYIYKRSGKDKEKDVNSASAGN